MLYAVYFADKKEYTAAEKILTKSTASLGDFNEDGTIMQSVQLLA
jgi:hypothetical protein